MHGFLDAGPGASPALRAMVLVAGALLPVAVWGGIARATPGSPCAEESELTQAAAAVVASARPQDPATLRSALASARSDAVGVRALWLAAGTPSEGPRASAWLTDVAAAADAPLACGRASGERGTLLLATARAGRLTLAKASPARLSGWLVQGFRDPQLVFLGADGRAFRRVLSPSELARGVVLDSELVRPARVQLVATGRRGPRPVAERVVGALTSRAEGGGHSAWDVVVPDPQAPIDGALNRLRRARRKPDVRRHARLRTLAAQHAHNVCQQGMVGHALSPGRDPEARLRAAGIETQRVGEAVARAAGPAAAFAALQRSPSHLMTLLESSFTDAGVGVARGPRGQACVVVMLARWPRFVGH